MGVREISLGTVDGLSALFLVHQIEGLQLEPRLADLARQTVQAPALVDRYLVIIGYYVHAHPNMFY